MVHFSSDGSTGSHKGQVDRPVARGAEFAGSKVEVIALRFKEIVMINGVT